MKSVGKHTIQEYCDELPEGINPPGTAGYPYLCPYCNLDNLEFDVKPLLKFGFRDTNLGFDPARWVWWEIICCENCKNIYKWEFHP